MLDGRPAEAAHPAAGGRRALPRLVGGGPAAQLRPPGRVLTCAILAGEGAEAAAYARAELEGACDSPASCYALAVAALAEGDDAAAARAAEAMREGGEAFARAAEALAALAAHDAGRYSAAVAAIVADFETRDAHLTGVPVSDAGLSMEALAGARGMAAQPRSPLMPETPTPPDPPDPRAPRPRSVLGRVNSVGAAFLITLREGFEAALIVAIVLAAVHRGGRQGLDRWIWAGVGVALALSIAVGAALRLTIEDLTGDARLRTFASICLAAASLLTWMIFWMPPRAGAQARARRAGRGRAEPSALALARWRSWPSPARAWRARCS